MASNALPLRSGVDGVARATRAGLRALRGRHWTLAVGGVIFASVVVILVLTPWIAPYDPAAQELTHRLAPPNTAHWLGTDQLGRDVLSRLMSAASMNSRLLMSRASPRARR